MTALFSLQEKVAIVTGGASGIGLATARRLHAAGATVAIFDLSDASAVAKEIDGTYEHVDMTAADQVSGAVDRIAGKLGKLDLMVNIVGGGTPPATLDDCTEYEFTFDFRLNLLTAAYGMQSAARHMQSGGAMVNTASVAGLRGTYSLGAYNAAKAALVNLTRTAALEYGSRGIRVNCVCPGVIDTPLAAEEDVDYIVKAATKAAPLGRIGKPGEVAALIHFLCSSDCGFITGESVTVDGGVGAGLSVGLMEACAADVNK